MCSSSSATLVIGVLAKRRPCGRVPSLTSSPILKLCLIDSQESLTTLVCMCPAPGLQEGGAEREEGGDGGTRQAERRGEGRKGGGKEGNREVEERGQMGTGRVCQGWSLTLQKLGHQGSGLSP